MLATILASDTLTGKVLTIAHLAYAGESKKATAEL